MRTRLLRSLIGLGLSAFVGCSAGSSPPADGESAAAVTAVGTVIGVIDGIAGDVDHPTITGWACETNNASSISIDLYLTGPNGTVPYQRFAANLASEPAVNSSCGATGSHRFSIAVTPDLLTRAYYAIQIYGISPDGGANNLLTGSAEFTIPVRPYVKHGDNGAVDCNVYCAGSQWGLVGSCMGVALDDFPCDQAIGYLSNNDAEQTCTCRDANGTFVKPGDNGTVDCNTFCAGSQWGRVGTCIGAKLSTNTSATVAGASVAYTADCSIAPGFIHNGAEQTCVCMPADSTPAAGKATVATGGTTSLDGMEMHDLAVASNSTSFRSHGGQLYIHEVGWGPTTEADRRTITQLFPNPPIFETGGPQAPGTTYEIVPYWPVGASVVCVDTSAWPLPGYMPASYAAQIKQGWGPRAGAIGVYYSPNDGKTFNTPFADPMFDGLRRTLLTAGALCTDAPPYFYKAMPVAYRAWTADSITWARAHGITVVSALFPGSSADLWADTQWTVNDLLARGANPTTWAINGYYGTSTAPHPIGSEAVPADSMYTALQLLLTRGAPPSR